MSFFSYAQNFEDVMLWRALGHVQDGRYLDIGAQDPVEFSVSLAFYEHGWRGMHVEPNLHYAELLRKARPDEAVLEVALGEESGIAEFFDIEGTGLSTLQLEIAERHRQAGFGVASRLVPMLTLDEVLARFRDEPPHWLKIDVEGAEKLVLNGWRQSLVRPWILVVESTLPMTQKESYSEWEPLLLSKGYQFSYFDGLNRFYVSEEHAELLAAFRYPPCVFDSFDLVGRQDYCHTLTETVGKLEESIRLLDGENQRLDSENQRLEAALAGHRAALDAARSRVEQASASEALLREEHARLQAEAYAERDHWRAAADDHEARLRALVQSRSWRITRPLRGLRRLLTEPKSDSRRIIRAYIRDSGRTLARWPAARRLASYLLRQRPGLKRRLVTFILGAAPRESTAVETSCPGSLSRTATEAMFLLRKARGG